MEEEDIFKGFEHLPEIKVPKALFKDVENLKKKKFVNLIDTDFELPKSKPEDIEKAIAHIYEKCKILCNYGKEILVYLCILLIRIEYIPSFDCLEDQEEKDLKEKKNKFLRWFYNYVDNTILYSYISLDYITNQYRDVLQGDIKIRDIPSGNSIQKDDQNAQNENVDNNPAKENSQEKKNEKEEKNDPEIPPPLLYAPFFYSSPLINFFFLCGYKMNSPLTVVWLYMPYYAILSESLDLMQNFKTNVDFLYKIADYRLRFSPEITPFDRIKYIDIVTEYCNINLSIQKTFIPSVPLSFFSPNGEPTDLNIKSPKFETDFPQFFEENQIDNLETSKFAKKHFYKPPQNDLAIYRQSDLFYVFFKNFLSQGIEPSFIIPKSVEYMNHIFTHNNKNSEIPSPAFKFIKDKNDKPIGEFYKQSIVEWIELKVKEKKLDNPRSKTKEELLDVLLFPFLKECQISKCLFHDLVENERIKEDKELEIQTPKQFLSSAIDKFLGR